MPIVVQCGGKPQNDLYLDGEKFNGPKFLLSLSRLVGPCLLSEHQSEFYDWTVKMPSLLWDFYDHVKGEKAKCKSCQKEVATVGGTTSGLKKHLKLHPKLLEDFLKKQEERDKVKEATTPKRPAEDQLVNERKPLKQMKLDFGAKEVTKVKQIEFDNCLVNFVAETGVSFNVLGSESFKALIEVANRQLVVKSPRTVSRKVDHSASRVLFDVCDILSAVKSTIPSVGFTTDMWTSLAQVVILIFQP